MENQKVWLPDPVEGYVLGIIEDINQDFVTAKTIRHPGKVSLLSITILKSPRGKQRVSLVSGCCSFACENSCILSLIRIRIACSRPVAADFDGQGTFKVTCCNYNLCFFSSCCVSSLLITCPSRHLHPVILLVMHLCRSSFSFSSTPAVGVPSPNTDYSDDPIRLFQHVSLRER